MVDQNNGALLILEVQASFLVKSCLFFIFLSISFYPLYDGRRKSFLDKTFFWFFEVSFEQGGGNAFWYLM